MAASSSQGHRHGSLLYFNRPQLKVSLSDHCLCRQASHHSTLTSYQQLHRVSHTAVRRDRDRREEKWDEQRPHHGHL